MFQTEEIEDRRWYGKRNRNRNDIAKNQNTKMDRGEPQRITGVTETRNLEHCYLYKMKTRYRQESIHCSNILSFIVSPNSQSFPFSLSLDT
jgi:hypothetical protein